MKKIIKTEKISVRNLVEFVHRSGNIDSGYAYSKNSVQETMAEGIRLHNKIQKQRIKEFAEKNFEYKKEVSVKAEFDYKNISFEIKGRIDGLVKNEDTLIIEEIKSTSQSLANLNFDSSITYKAQAMMYGYIYGEQQNFENITIQITYISSISEEELCFSKDFHIRELEDFFMETIESYYKFVKLGQDKWERLVVTGDKMDFPFSGYRKNQREFMKAVYSSIREKKKLFGEAPTGVGKTLSTMFPSIKALVQGCGKKIFYITSKTITRTVAEESLLLMKIKGLEVASVTFTAKDKICVCDETICMPSYCHRAKGHLDRINNALYDILTNENIITRDIINKYSEKHMVCPFEFQLDISNFSQVVICDYNYVYNPRVHLKRYFENEKNDFIILVDESHNLESRGREMFSATIEKKDFLFLKKVFTTKKSTSLAKEINAQMLALGNESENGVNVYEDEVKTLAYLLEDLRFYLDGWFEKNQDNPLVNEVLDIYFKIDTYCKTSAYFDEKYRMLVEKKNRDVIIRLFCLDPSTRFSLVNILCRSVIYFSATFTPIEYFSSLYGGTKEDYSLKLDSPFPKENLLLLKDTSVSTYYKDREKSYDIIAEKIIDFISCKQGNYFIFFSSYDYLNIVYEKVINLNPFLKILPQQQNMGEDSKEWFLNQFSENNKETTVGFLVLGGIFSEGINLVGNKLIGVCIVGVGVGKINFVDNVIKDYYDKKYNMGYEYAYMYQGMNKVLQGGGRVIRSETDRGTILLLDNRYGRKDYISLFPNHWKHCVQIKGKEDMIDKLTKFW